ncbi:hypothetical protein [Streptomyces sp. NPDC007883]|uniref:hypothetical protein n=1 Tax=Streptomyces sp. NPDC007883 TaxID=3155116 RepID=UPI0033E04A04
MITGYGGSAHHGLWAGVGRVAGPSGRTALHSTAVEPAPRGRTGPGFPRHAAAHGGVGRKERRRHHPADHIKTCVKAVDDADKEFRKDLEAAVKDSGGRNDGTAGGFNGNADKVVKADDQKKQRMELASPAMRDGETLDDCLQRLRKEGVEKGGHLAGRRPAAGKLLHGVLIGGEHVVAHEACPA